MCGGVAHEMNLSCKEKRNQPPTSLTLPGAPSGGGGAGGARGRTPRTGAAKDNEPAKTKGWGQGGRKKTSEEPGQSLRRSKNGESPPCTQPGGAPPGTSLPPLPQERRGGTRKQAPTSRHQRAEGGGADGRRGGRRGGDSPRALAPAAGAAGGSEAPEDDPWPTSAAYHSGLGGDPRSPQLGEEWGPGVGPRGTQAAGTAAARSPDRRSYHDGCSCNRAQVPAWNAA